MVELKNCPFCGSKAELYGDCEMVKARCTNPECWCHLVTWFDEPEEAAEEWNRRTPPAEENEPLTLEQLLEMDGQPVWVDHPDGYKHYNGWTLVFVSWKVQKQVRVTYATGGSGDVSLLLDDGARIYRRPPAEG